MISVACRQSSRPDAMTADKKRLFCRRYEEGSFSAQCMSRDSGASEDALWIPSFLDCR